MSVLDIVQWPDPRLAQVCAPVAEITPRIETLARDMLDTMYAAPGRGLAGPQVGVLERIFVMDTDWKDGTADPQVFINPVLEDASDALADWEEGCLSIPGVTALVSRPATVRMGWTALDGARCARDFSGFAAVCVQHEMDHLDGVVTFDHLTAEARAPLEADYLKALA